MREVTYGWYPSINNIYRPKGRPSSKHLKCLYNFQDYRGQILPHASELFVRGVSSATPTSTPQDVKRKSKSVPVPKFCSESKIYIPTPTQCWSKNTTLQETQWGIIDDATSHSSNPPSEVSWPIPQDGNQQQQKYQEQQQLLKEHIQRQQQENNFLDRNQTPQKEWGSQKFCRDPSPPCSETSSVLTWPVAHKSLSLRPQSSYSGQSTSYQQEKIRIHKQRPASSPVKSVCKGQRETKSSRTPLCVSSSQTSLSATVRPEKTPLSTTTGRQSVQEHEVVVPSSSHYELEKPPTRPAVPVPFVNYDNELEESRNPPRSASPDENNYDKIVNLYGWRAQIHGDPYQLKKPMKRASYTVKCPAPELLPDPPNVHMETKEPFFYNTIPRKPLSFSVDKEWMSEVLLAKRLELQKRYGGIKYNYKNFAFVY